MVLLAAVADSAERAIENNVIVLDNSPTSTVKGKNEIEKKTKRIWQQQKTRVYRLNTKRLEIRTELKFAVKSEFLFPNSNWTMNIHVIFHFTVNLETLPPPPPPPASLYTTTTNHLNPFSESRRSQLGVSIYSSISFFLFHLEREKENFWIID